MKFGAVPLAQAEGALLAHSVLLPDGHRLRKGLFLTGADLAKLEAAGITHPVVARLTSSDVHEDEAAERLGRALVSDPARQHLKIGRADRGSLFVHATALGILVIDEAAVIRLNTIDPMLTLATPPPFTLVFAGTLVGSIKTISYAVSETNLRRVERVAARAIRIQPPVITTASLIETMLKGDQKHSAKGQRAVAHRMKTLGIELIESRRVAHDDIAVQAAIADARGEMILILTASATSDRNDIAPKALRRAGGKLIRFGMPVDPGHLLFYGDLMGRPVIGLPGCARSLVPNGADFVIERLACGLAISARDFARMGIGGLLKDTPLRGLPREPRLAQI